MGPGIAGYHVGMAPDSPDWTVPIPVRALMWWPGVAFVLVLVAPQSAAGSIAVAGLVLAGVGLLVERLDRRPRDAAPDEAEPDREPARAT